MELSLILLGIFFWIILIFKAVFDFEFKGVLYRLKFMMWKNIKVIIGRREKLERIRDIKFCLWSIFWLDGEVGKWEVKKMVRNDFEKEFFDN